MALFSTDTKKTLKKASAPKAVSEKKFPEDGRLEGILARPWLSEKALIGTENGVYVFEVPARATKTTVSQAVQMIYKVTPRQVRMVNLPAKKVNLRTRRGVGTRARRHKAYVYLKKGETIQFA
jgi:large subunit ribosomal protein L23